MDVYFAIFIRRKTSMEIKKAVVKIFGIWGLEPASVEEKTHYSRQLENLNREGFLPRAFLLSPELQSWCFLLPSYEVWFSEAQDLCELLSNELTCPVLLLLQDDSNGWGYFLYNKGKVIDKFHTDPSSPTLYLRGATSFHDLEFMLAEPREITPDEAKTYEGHPDIIAKAFNVQSDKIAHYLYITRKYSGSITHYEMADLINKGLGVPEEWGRLYYDIYSGRIENADQWFNLVFIRKMTSAEKAWYNTVPLDAYGTSPPLWVNE